MDSCRHTIDFLGVNIDVLDTSGLYKKIIDFIYDKKSHKIMYVNAHCIVISQKNEKYRKILNNAHCVYADGMSIVWGAKVFGNYLPGRSTCADFILGFCKLFAEKGIRIYLLGGRPGVAEVAAEKLKQCISGLKIVGTHHGYFYHQGNERIINKINKSKAQILLVGLGVPEQEKWIEKNFSLIDGPVIWGVGGVFDFLSGRVKRGPKYLLNNGLEWLWRLFIEPRRLWKRYITGNFLFVWYVVNWRLYKKRMKKIYPW